MTKNFSSNNLSPSLLLAGICKSYPGVQAVRDVTFRSWPGQIHALVGENGAGKTTLMNVASGNVAADQGSISILGKALEVADPGTARHLGLAMVYQDDSLIPDLDVAQNLRLGAQPESQPRFRDLYTWAETELNRFDMPLNPHTPVRDLSIAARQVLEIVKALILKPRLLVLDEPTAALAANEVQHLHKLLLATAAQGTSIVYITHRLREVLSVAHVVSVMRDGEMVEAAIAVQDTDEDKLVQMMVGRSLNTAFPAKPIRAVLEPILEVRNISSDSFSNTSIVGYAGEILGVAGIEGNGQREFLRALAGLYPYQGSVVLNGTQVRSGDVPAARQAGLTYISGDRHGEALFMRLSIRENISVGPLPSLSKYGLINLNRERQLVEHQIQVLEVKAHSQEQAVETLSGGNQQKVALARAFAEEPRVYLVEEPTQGVDAGTRLEIYRQMRDIAQQKNVLIIVLSTDALEVAGLCDRVIVFARGKIVEELEGENLTEDNIVGAAARSAAHRDNNATSLNTDNLLANARNSDFTPVILLLISLAGIAIATGIARPLFFTSTNIGNMLFLAVPLGFVALAQALVMLIGGIDLSVGPLVALVTVAMAQIMMPGVEAVGVGLAIIASLGIGVTIGALNTFLVLRVHLIPLIATLATYILIQGIALLWSPNTSGYVLPEFSALAKWRVGMIPLAFILLTIITLGGEILYRRSSIGMAYRAVGSRPAAARRLGVNLTIITIAAYISAGFFAAVSGIFFTSTISIGDPRLGINFTLASITAVVLGGLSTWGGRGSLIGPLLGAVLLAMISNALAFMNMPSEIQFYVQGALMIGAIAVYSRLRVSGSSVDEVASGR